MVGMILLAIFVLGVDRGRRSCRWRSCRPRAPRASTVRLDLARTSPELVEREVIRPVEQQMAGLRGLQKIQVGSGGWGDFGLSPQEFRPLLEWWNETCEPAWSPRELEKKLSSAVRNRKRPVGCRLMEPLVPERSRRTPTSAPAVAEVWAIGQPLSGPESHDAYAVYWASRRGLMFEELVERDLVRVLPRRAPVAEQCRFDGRLWTEQGYRLIFPTHNSRGELVGVRARHIDTRTETVTGEEPIAGAKELSPCGVTSSGQVFANEAGRRLLAGATVAGPVWFAEGGPDFATLAVRLPTDTPVLGVFSGSWTTELAERIPDGFQVILAMDPDKAGARYARAIATTLIKRCEVWLLELPEGVDVNEAHRGGSLDLRRLRRFADVELCTVEEPATPVKNEAEGEALALLNGFSVAWEGPVRELARAVLLFHGRAVSPPEVRRLERALMRLHQGRGLPERVKITSAVNDNQTTWLDFTRKYLGVLSAMMQAQGEQLSGSARELARQLLACSDTSATAAAVRGVERALQRLERERGLPDGVEIFEAWPSPFAPANAQAADVDVAGDRDARLDVVVAGDLDAQLDVVDAQLDVVDAQLDVVDTQLDAPLEVVVVAGELDVAGDLDAEPRPPPGRTQELRRDTPGGEGPRAAADREIARALEAMGAASPAVLERLEALRRRN
jgi:hypothetical protein